MVVDTTKETLCVNQIIAQKTELIELEGDIIIPDIKPDILNSVTTSGNVFIYKKDILDGKIKLDGMAAVYVVYLADGEGAVRGLYTTLDFTKAIELEKCKSEMRLDERVTVKNIECKVLNSRKISVRVILEANVKIYSNDNVDVIQEINDAKNVQFLRDSIEINSLIGEGGSRVSAKDTISVDDIDIIAEILKSDIRITNKDLKISYNKILAKGDAEVKIMYLTEDNRIKTVTGVVPVMGFVDIANISEDNNCEVKYRIKNLIIKPNIEEHSIYVEAEIELYCIAYENKTIDIIQDLYSPTEKLNFNQKKIQVLTRKDCKKDMYTLKNRVSIPEMSSGMVFDMQSAVNITNKTILTDKVMIEGEINIDVIYQNGSNIELKKIKLPYSYELELKGINSNCNVEIEEQIETQDFIILKDGNIDVKIDILFNIEISNNTFINVIDEITKEETRKEDLYNLIVYFVKKGDTLWKIAKEFGSIIEDIVRINGIEDANRIFPGQQLYIPR